MNLNPSSMKAVAAAASVASSGAASVASSGSNGFSGSGGNGVLTAQEVLDLIEENGIAGLEELTQEQLLASLPKFLRSDFPS